MAWPTKTTFVDGDVLTAAEVNNIGTNLNVFNPTSATNGQVWVADGAGSGAYGTVASGLTLIKPATINFTGTSATIGTNGTVTFTAVSVLSLNQVFSSTYDQYFVLLRGSHSGGGGVIPLRMRNAGTDADGANTYWQQNMAADGTTLTGSFAQSNRCEPAFGGTDYGAQLTFYNPFAADQTVIYSTSASTFNNRYLVNGMSQHTVASSYDGFSLRLDLAGTNITGTIAVYGYRK